jgi:hypothetical protein
MRIEIEKTEETVVKSVKYVERCAIRLASARHVSASLFCINAAAQHFQNIDGDLMAILRQANVPLIMALILAFRRNARELEDKIRNHGSFRTWMLPVSAQSLSLMTTEPDPGYIWIGRLCEALCRESQ